MAVIISISALFRTRCKSSVDDINSGRGKERQQLRGHIANLARETAGKQFSLVE